MMAVTGSLPIERWCWEHRDRQGGDSGGGDCADGRVARAIALAVAMLAVTVVMVMWVQWQGCC